MNNWFSESLFYIVGKGFKRRIRRQRGAPALLLAKHIRTTKVGGGLK